MMRFVWLPSAAWGLDLTGQRCSPHPPAPNSYTPNLLPFALAHWGANHKEIPGTQEGVISPGGGIEKKEQHINNNKKQQNTPNTVLRSTSILAQWCCTKRLLLSLPLHLPLAHIGCLCLALIRYDLLTLHTHTHQKLRQLQQRFPLLQRDVWKPMAPKKLVN